MKMIKDTFANWRSVHKFYFLFYILTPLVSPSLPRKTTMWFLVLAPELFVCSTKLTWGRDYYITLWQAFNNTFTWKYFHFQFWEWPITPTQRSSSMANLQRKFKLEKAFTEQIVLPLFVSQYWYLSLANKNQLLL